MCVIGTKMDSIDVPLRSEFLFMNRKNQKERGCSESFYDVN
ncbi:hypothetical protein GQ55_3G408000 [Panicum hallii var. hallii]|uniref:Uncharacterized protein n=2 Tax=Panicum hallii TaxID=206008 RepID=A0A2T7EH28_9POAL|nr:hypothetical protein GQ55_3G408000 [Panicum hallii var. hallii]PVH62919.1 hypothetical protein PAHAL_3G429600 [Panicum hallii]